MVSSLKTKILVVDGDTAVRQDRISALSKEGAYELHGTGDSAHALSMAAEIKPDVIVSDTRVGTLDSLDLCRLARGIPGLATVVFILLTGQEEMNRGRECSVDGPDDYLDRMNHPSSLACRIRGLLELRRLQREVTEEKGKTAHATERLDKNFKELINILLKVIETSIPGANERAGVARAAAHHIANQMDLDAGIKKEILLAATLHEIGKIGLPETIKGESYDALSPADQRTYQQHPIIGSAIISAIAGFRDTAFDVYHQLENFDGSGTPSALRGEEIRLGARILRAIVFQEELFMAGYSTEKVIDRINASLNKTLDPMVASRIEEFLTQNDKYFVRNKEKLKIEELQPGMIVAEDVYSSGGVKLLPKGAVLQEKMIQLIIERNAADPVLGCIYITKKPGP